MMEMIKEMMEVEIGEQKMEGKVKDGDSLLGLPSGLTCVC